MALVRSGSLAFEVADASPKRGIARRAVAVEPEEHDVRFPSAAALVDDAASLAVLGHIRVDAA